jgi:DNA-binding NtrC family response regulator
VREQLDRLVHDMFDRGIRLEDAVEEVERRYIARALVQADGSLTDAAARLGIHRNTLTRRATALGLHGGRRRAARARR